MNVLSHRKGFDSIMKDHSGFQRTNFSSVTAPHDFFTVVSHGFFASATSQGEARAFRPLADDSPNGETLGLVGEGGRSAAPGCFKLHREKRREGASSIYL